MAASSLANLLFTKTTRQLTSYITHIIRRKMSQKLYFPSGEYISYHHSPGSFPGVMFLPGLMSNMNGTKARVIERYCRETDRAYTRFDHRGLGESSGKPEQCTVGSRKEDVLRLLREIQGPHVLVGSSLGGWTMLHVAMEIPDQVKGLVGIATAVDFITRIFKNFSEKDINEIKASGKWAMKSQYSSEPYVFTWDMIQDAQNHVLEDSIPISCPVRLVHGMKDQEVPYQLSVDLVDRLESSDVQVTLIKDGSHRLSEPKNLEIIVKTLEDLLGKLNKSDATSKI